MAGMPTSLALLPEESPAGACAWGRRTYSAKGNPRVTRSVEQGVEAYPFIGTARVGTAGRARRAPARMQGRHGPLNFQGNWMSAGFNDDDWISTDFRFDKAASALLIKIAAKKSVRIVELQGDRSLLEAFGASAPSGIREMKFGEGVEIPDGMRDDIEFMNKSQFRWGCDFPIGAGATHEIRLPAQGPGTEKGVITIVYEFPKLLGLLKGKQGQYARLSAT